MPQLYRPEGPAPVTPAPVAAARSEGVASEREALELDLTRRVLCPLEVCPVCASCEPTPVSWALLVATFVGGFTVGAGIFGCCVATAGAG